METPPDTDSLFEQLIECTDRADGPACAALLEGRDASEVVHAVTRLTEERRRRLIELLGPQEGAELLGLLPEHQVVEAIEGLNAQTAARLIEHLASDERADLVARLDPQTAAAVLAHLGESAAREVRRLASYAEDSAGGLMITEYLRYPSEYTIAQVIEDLGLRADEYSRYDIQYAYVTDGPGRLVGVLRMRDLLLSPRSRPLRDVMISTPASVRDTATLDDLINFFEEHRFFGAPVLDAGGRLCGVLQKSAVEAAVAEDRDRMYRRSQGIVGGDELRSMPLLVRSRRRLSWLSINIVLNIIAASVIAANTETLEAVIALAVFLPIISDMSGCSGNQAVAVSMRELTLGVIRPTELRRALLGEAMLGVINGLALGLLVALAAFAWQRNIYLGMVVGAALMLNTMVAVLIGGSVPLILKRLNFDPALASGPILTTITDMCGFFFVLTFAAAMLAHLV